MFNRAAEKQAYRDLRASSTHLAPHYPREHEQLISPPPAFRSSEPALNKLPTETMPPLVGHELDSKSTHLRQKEASSMNQATQLTTKLTRTRKQQTGKDTSNKFRQQQQEKRTMTKFEQSILAPESRGQEQREGKIEVQSGKDRLRDHQVKGCHFKAQVMFESDTDSMSVSERQSGASQSSRCSSSNANVLKSSTSKRARKELVSETKFSSTRLNNNASGVASKQTVEQQSGKYSNPQRGDDSTVALAAQNTHQRVIESRPDFSEPGWDYSLRVNRMRGNKVDSKVK